MFNTDMRSYTYFTLGGDNGYGQPILSKEPVGEVKLAIYTTSQQVQTNINYTDASYIALTHDAAINDTYVIDLGDGKLLKVLYIQPQGRFKQVFLKSYD